MLYFERNKAKRYGRGFNMVLFYMFCSQVMEIPNDSCRRVCQLSCNDLNIYNAVRVVNVFPLLICVHCCVESLLIWHACASFEIFLTV